MKLPAKAKLRAIEWYQNEAYVHPLTCATDSNHPDLDAVIVHVPGGESQVYLECIQCGYTQDWVPEFVYEMYLRHLAMGVAMVRE